MPATTQLRRNYFDLRKRSLEQKSYAKSMRRVRSAKWQPCFSRERERSCLNPKNAVSVVRRPKPATSGLFLPPSDTQMHHCVYRKKLLKATSENISLANIKRSPFPAHHYSDCPIPGLVLVPSPVCVSVSVCTAHVTVTVCLCVCQRLHCPCYCAWQR